MADVTQKYCCENIVDVKIEDIIISTNAEDT
jgi:hypothetical protein